MGSRIEAGLTIEGSVRGEGELIVAGRLRGVLTLHGTLVIEEGGAVEAEVEANAVVVAGLLSGSVTAHDELRVLPGGTVDARVRATRLAMSEGAVFRGDLLAANAVPLGAHTPSQPARIAGARTAAQLAANSHADAIPPIPTLHKSSNAHTLVAAAAPPVRHQTINPPTSPAPAPMDSSPPIPTTPAPPMPSRRARGTVPPAPRVPNLGFDPDTLRPPTPRPRAFAAPPAKPRARADAAPPKSPEVKPREAPPLMPALPRKRASMSRRGGA